MIVIKEGADVGMYSLWRWNVDVADWIDIGANASAEDAGDELEEGQKTVNNIVHSFRLNPTSFDKNSYKTYLKGMFPHPSPASSR